MDLAQVRKLQIPQGQVKQIHRKTDGLLLWKGGYTNLVPFAVDTDGNVFDGIGYREGYRLSSSGNLSAQPGTVTTGFISCKASDVLRMAGVSWVPGNASIATDYCYIAFYSTSYALLGSYNVAENGANTARGIVTAASSAVTDSSGVTVFQMAFSNGAEIAWFRLNGYGSGADMIVTVNEEIAR